MACKFFLIVCLSRHFDVHFNFHPGRCCFGAPWKHDFICEFQVAWFSNAIYHITCYMFLLRVLLVCRMMMFIFLIKSYSKKKKSSSAPKQASRDYHYFYLSLWSGSFFGPITIYPLFIIQFLSCLILKSMQSLLQWYGSRFSSFGFKKGKAGRTIS